MDQSLLLATEHEQYITIEVLQSLINQLLKEEYTHMHWDAIRLLLTYNGRKECLVSTRMALLDSRVLDYQNAVIGVVMTTLNAGSVMLTFYPNFVMSLRDPSLSTGMKVHIQIQGVSHVALSYIATLHQQVCFRVQDHAIDLNGYGSPNTLYVFSKTVEKVPTIIKASKQLDTETLEKLVPSSWLTNYEKIRTVDKTVQSQDYIFHRRKDGVFETIFKTPEDSRDDKPCSSLFKTTSMICPVLTDKKIHVVWFEPCSHPVYTDKINGHFIWDVDPNMCKDGCACAKDDFPGDKKRKTRSSCRPFPKPKDKDGESSLWICISEDMRKRSDKELAKEWKRRLSLYAYDEALKILRQEGLCKTEVVSSVNVSTVPGISCCMAYSSKPTEESSYKSDCNNPTQNYHA